MQVKIDTKQKFHVITLQEPQITANMTDELAAGLGRCLQNDVKNLVVNVSAVEGMDLAAAETLVSLQQRFYEGNASFVICGMQPAVESFLDGEGLLDVLNCTPTESEAWDIVQMEEIERELLDDGEPLFE